MGNRKFYLTLYNRTCELELILSSQYYDDLCISCANGITEALLIDLV